MATQTDQQDGLDTRVVRREYISAMGDLTRFVPQLESLAWRWRLRDLRDPEILGEGAPWIWKLAADHFSLAVEILDFWHLTEHLWQVARAMHGVISRNYGSPALLMKLAYSAS